MCHYCATYWLHEKYSTEINSPKCRIDFQSRWRLASPHNHIKSTTKLYNNHHLEPSEIMLNRSLTTTELKKPHPSRLVGRVDTWNELVQHPHVVDKNLGGISWEQGVPAHHPAPPAQDSSARKISPHNFWLQKSAGIELVEGTSGVPNSSS